MTAQGDEHALASALVELLASSPVAVARLRELVDVGPEAVTSQEPPAYTVASLAAALGVSPRVIRGAITRGELHAAKRGGRWIVSVAAVRRWAESDMRSATTAAARRRDNGGRSLTTVMALLDAGANHRRDHL
jgi:excisionase family DNA binding protein